MSKQVIIINITRMGDLFQMSPLLARLNEEWPGVAIDLVVDKEFSGVADLVPGIRHVWAYDFQQLLDDCRAKVRDVVSLYRDVATWASLLHQVGYDRVINLTFNRRSAFLASFLGCSDVRGLTTTPGGQVVVRNPWMKYLLDFQQYRCLNRFNIVDLFALGGSGPGTFHGLRLQIPKHLAGWADGVLGARANPRFWIGVQVGASDPIKAWRSAYYGRMMAFLAASLKVGFIMIGTKKEDSSIQEALQAYRQAGGQAPVCEMQGGIPVSESLALLSRCHLMVTNDTGPMHMAVGVGTPVVNLSVGHVDFRETGPFGPGHWVIQPDIACGPCGFDTVCPHHACKDRIEPHQVAELCRFVLKKGEFPQLVPSVRVYEGGIDEDQLGDFVLRTGNEEPTVSWLAKFWRKFWYEAFTNSASRVSDYFPIPPGVREREINWTTWDYHIDALCQQADQFLALCRIRPIPVNDLQQLQEKLKQETWNLLRLTRSSLVTGPLVNAFFRDIHNLESVSLEGLAKEHAQAYYLLRRRFYVIRDHMEPTTAFHERGMLYASHTG